MVTPVKPVEIGPFKLGMNNRASDTALVVPQTGAGTGGTFLRSAVNVDIKNTGTVKRRQGSTLALAATDGHSFYAESLGSRAYMVDGTALYALSGPPEALARTVLRNGMTPGRKVAFTDADGITYWTDGVVLRRIVNGVDQPVGVPMLTPEPVVSAAPGGAIDSGLYQVCFTLTNAAGEESASTTPAHVAVVNGAIAISNLPAAFPTGVSSIVVYMSPQNGDELLYAAELFVPQTTLVIPVVPPLGRRCQTLLMKPMPPGSALRYNNGRLMVASGNYLFYSRPFSPALYYPRKDYVSFDTPVRTVECVATGTYVTTDTWTYFFDGDIGGGDAAAKQLVPVGGIAGTSGASPDALRCWWMSPRGIVKADSQGNITNVTEDNIAMNTAKQGTALFREQDGLKQIVTSLFGSDTTGATARSFMSAEIIRKATIL